MVGKNTAERGTHGIFKERFKCTDKILFYHYKYYSSSTTNQGDEVEHLLLNVLE